jgi:tetratricopeptide (TPR) repeat protein
MSSSPLIVLTMALSSLLVLPGTHPLFVQTGSVAELLLKDEIEQAEALLASQPKNSESVAFRGEIEFRRGNFAQAEALYKEAVGVDSKNARAHFGLGKLAMARVNAKEAIQELTRAIELDPKEPLYRLYASDAWGIDKNSAGPPD